MPKMKTNQVLKSDLKWRRPGAWSLRRQGKGTVW